MSECISHPQHNGLGVCLFCEIDTLELENKKLREHKRFGRMFSALVIGEDSGLLGEPKHNWDAHPKSYERVTLIEVVKEALPTLIEDK